MKSSVNGGADGSRDISTTRLLRTNSGRGPYSAASETLDDGVLHNNQNIGLMRSFPNLIHILSVVYVAYPTIPCLRVSTRCRELPACRDGDCLPVEDAVEICKHCGWPDPRHLLCGSVIVVALLYTLNPSVPQGFIIAQPKVCKALRLCWDPFPAAVETRQTGNLDNLRELTFPRVSFFPKHLQIICAPFFVYFIHFFLSFACSVQSRFHWSTPLRATRGK